MGSVVISNDVKFRLRPSVSLIPTSDEMVWEFFQSNTRRLRHVRVHDLALIESVKNLDGASVGDLVEKNGLQDELPKFLDYLSSACLVEENSVAQQVNESQYNRIINFLGDYFPSHELLAVFERVRSSHVLIVGLGAIGSWISLLLAQSGVSQFTLCDPDIVKTNNLNRSLFMNADIGVKKIDAVIAKLKGIDKDIDANGFDIMIESIDDLERVKSETVAEFGLVINASDFPNVDFTSEMVSSFCMKHDIPHIIAGGYNLHLSLIGPTILPYESPCLLCIGRGLKEDQSDDFSRVRKLYRSKRNIGNLSPLAGISASFACFEAIRVLVKSEKLRPEMTGRRGEFNFLTSKLNFSEYSRRRDCEWCGKV